MSASSLASLLTPWHTSKNAGSALLSYALLSDISPVSLRRPTKLSQVKVTTPKIGTLQACTQRWTVVRL